MIEVHLRALEALLRGGLNQQELKTVDHWNNQVLGFSKDNNFVPAIYMDFGMINWQPLVGDIIQQGKCTIHFHCVNYDYRISRDKAFDDDGKRLKRFDWSNKIMKTLNGKAGKDQANNSIFNRLQLVGSQFDTNRDALYDDVLVFNCQLFYYGAWRELCWKEIILQGVNTTYDSTITI